MIVNRVPLNYRPKYIVITGSKLINRFLFQWKSTILLLFWLFPHVISAQDQKISVNIRDEKLKDVLEQLSSAQNLNFTYNASDDVFSSRITYSCTNKQAGNAIKEILALVGLRYKKVGNHQVIFHENETLEVPLHDGREILKDQVIEDEKTAIIPDTVIKTIEKPVYITDTVIVRETLTRTDTVFLRDTIWIEPSETSPRKTTRVRDLRNVFRFEPERENAWSVAFSYAQMAAGYAYLNGNFTGELKKIRESEKTSFRNFSLGSSIQFHQDRFIVSGGIFLTGFSHSIRYTRDFSEGGFYNVDTLDIFYTINQSDTSWTYITDSLWVPLNREVNDYDRYNRIGLLESQLSAGYIIFAANDISVYLNAALRVGVPVWSDGITFSDEPDYQVSELDNDDLKKITAAYRFASGVRYRSGTWTDVFAEIFYRRHTSKIIESYPADRRLQAIGLNVGLVYYL